jgi:hypothetical protein
MDPTTRHPADVHDWLVVHDPLPVSAWIDRHVDTTGVDARSAYVETYWLGLLGPSCVLVARRLVAWLDAEPAGFEISLAALASTLGLGSSTGRRAPVVRTLTRLVDFHLANIDQTFAIRRKFPPLTARQSARLPDHLAATHALDHAAVTTQRGTTGSHHNRLHGRSAR